MPLSGTLAYVGPGAGIAVGGPVLAILGALLLAVLVLLSLPIRLAIGAIRRRRIPVRRGVRRVVVLGLDGFDPALGRRMMEAGDLPNMARLAGKGHFGELATTTPPISPVAWSTFATGTNPGKHGIFDFLRRNPRTYGIELSSAKVTQRRSPLPFFRPGAHVEPLRRSKAFWHVLSEKGLPSTILRVPVTFPPEKFKGLMLSGMCTPDIRGTQGSFTLFSNDPQDLESTDRTGVVIPLTVNEGQTDAGFPGPSINGRRLSAAMSVRITGDMSATLTVSGRRICLEAGRFSEWTAVTFRSGLTRVRGVCRFRLLTTAPRLRIYATPVSIDPAKPTLPVSHPTCYSAYLALKHGLFSTLGLAEDTSALDAGILDGKAFLEQARDLHEEREAILMDALTRARRGVLAGVFDLPDRVQHMFPLPGTSGDGSGAVREAYRLCDETVGRVMDRVGPDTVLFVISDHGAAPFRTAVNLNAWLKERGYLATKEGAGNAAYPLNIDWGRTRAYALGLSGVYLNVRGREAEGVVRIEKARSLAGRIASELSEIRDPATNQRAVRKTCLADDVYSGPYVGEGPDIFVGWEEGFRVSSTSAEGETTGPVLAENARKWQNDHCMDAELVPGALLCNRPIDAQGRTPHIMDMAPTILDLLGVSVPGYMDGTPLKVGGRNERTEA